MGTGCLCVNISLWALGVSMGSTRFWVGGLLFQRAPFLKVGVWCNHTDSLVACLFQEASLKLGNPQPSARPVLPEAVSNGSQKYGAQDVRLEGAGVQTAEERREAQKLRSFAADAYESDEKAFGSDMPTFQPSPQNPEVKLLFHRGDGNAIPDFGDNA